MTQLLITDVGYMHHPEGQLAKAVGGVYCVYSHNLTRIFSITKLIKEPYIPGEFYRRELPPLLELLKLTSQHHVYDAILVDGYVDLGPGRPGLGRHLHTALQNKKPIVGLAKNPYQQQEAPVGTPLSRGKSHKPLWVTATEKLNYWKDFIKDMPGPYRIPTAIKKIDKITKTG